VDGPDAPPGSPAVGDVGFVLDGAGALLTAEPVAVTRVLWSDQPGAPGWFYTTTDPTTTTAHPVADWLPLHEAEAVGLWSPEGAAAGAPAPVAPAYRDF